MRRARNDRDNDRDSLVSRAGSNNYVEWLG